MICPNCGLDCEDSQDTCPLCGYSFAEKESPAPADIPQPEAAAPQYAPADTAAVPKKKNTAVIVLAILVAVLVLAGATMAALLLMRHNDNGGSQTAASVQTTLTTTTTEATTTTKTTTAATTEAATTTEATATTAAATEAATEAAASESGIDYFSAYYTGLELTNVSNADGFYKGYTLFDINHDGTREFILKMGSSEAETVYKIWTISGNQILYCGEAEGFSCHLEEFEGNLYTMLGHTQYEAATRISMDSNYSISEQIVYEHDLDDTEDYSCYGTDVGMYDISDTSLLLKLSTATFDAGHYSYQEDY